jgi:hypothetical protein
MKINFNPDSYQKTGWISVISYLEMDNYKPRLIVRVATGRKYWPIFSEVINPELGLNDPALNNIKASFQSYTHPMVQRFISELNVMLSDIYQCDVSLSYQTRTQF